MAWLCGLIERLRGRIALSLENTAMDVDENYEENRGDVPLPGPSDSSAPGASPAVSEDGSGLARVEPGLADPGMDLTEPSAAKGEEPSAFTWDPSIWPPLPPEGYDSLLRSNKDVSKLADSPHDPELWKRAFRDAGDGTNEPKMHAIRALRALIWHQTHKAAQRSLKSGLPPLDLVQPNDETEVVRLQQPVHSHGDGQFQGQFQVKVLERDMLEEAGELVANHFSVAVLNMASASSPGGGYLQGAGAQEENLHRRSDAYRFTVQQKRHYPIKQDVCLLSKNVTVFRGPEKEGYPFLEKSFRTSMISCAALSHPRLTSSRDYRDPEDRRAMETKVKLIIEAAVRAGCDAVVLSAFGCGAFGNPPEVVAKMFHEELQRSHLRSVTFCIFDDHNAGDFHNPRGNFQPFLEVFRHG